MPKNNRGPENSKFDPCEQKGKKPFQFNHSEKMKANG